MKPVLELLQRIEANPSDAESQLSSFVADHTFPIADENQAGFFW